MSIACGSIIRHAVLMAVRLVRGQLRDVHKEDDANEIVELREGLKDWMATCTQRTWQSLGKEATERNSMKAGEEDATLTMGRKVEACILSEHAE